MRDVAIVGYGPTGATLANLLGAAGMTVTVFDSSSAPHPQPRACHIDGEIARVWQQCGCAEQLHELLTVSAGMDYVDASGQPLFSFEGFERQPLMGWHEDYVFVQPQIEAMLRAGVQRYLAVDVRLGRAAPPVAELLDDHRFVVGCDGASSGVRHQIGAELVDLGYDEHWLVVDIDIAPTAEVALPSVIHQVCDPRRLATFVPGHGSHRRWEFALRDGEVAPDVWTLLAPWRVTPANATLVRAAVYRFHALVADRWRGGPDGRVFLAGDAAHQMPPFMGQGLCSGVRDAANLWWKLASAADDDGRRLDTYESERRPHVEAIVAMSIEAGRTLHRLAADPADVPVAAVNDPQRWSRLPGLELGSEFPVGHLAAQPDRFDDDMPSSWVWVTDDASFVAPDSFPVIVDRRARDAAYGRRAALLRPDRYIAAVA